MKHNPNITPVIDMPAALERVDADMKGFEKAMQAKGFLKTEAAFRINWLEDRLNMSLECKPTADSDWTERKHVYLSTDSEEPFNYGSLMDRAEAWIAALKTPTQVKAEAFKKRLAQLIDTARAEGYDVAVTPLEEIMNVVHENLIEHQPEAAE